MGVRTSTDKGREGEERAARELEKAGFKILERNWRPLEGGKFLAEIDIVAEDRDAIVFVEVKSFSTFNADTLEYVLGRRKRASITRGAKLFLASHTEYAARAVRFDVCFCGPDGFRHIPGAFEAPEEAAR